MHCSLSLLFWLSKNHRFHDDHNMHCSTFSLNLNPLSTWISASLDHSKLSMDSGWKRRNDVICVDLITVICISWRPPHNLIVFCAFCYFCIKLSMLSAQMTVVEFFSLRLYDASVDAHRLQTTKMQRCNKDFCCIFSVKVQYGRVGSMKGRKCSL